MAESGSEVAKPNLLSRMISEVTRRFTQQEKTQEQLRILAEKEAASLARNVQKKSGDRGVCMTLGWGAKQTDDEIERFTNFNYPITSKWTGDELAILYEQIRRFLPEEKIIVVVSSFRPTSSFSNEEDVINRLTETSQQNGWSNPYIVGVPQEGKTYAGLQEFTDTYLGDLRSPFEPRALKWNQAIFTTVREGRPVRDLRRYQKMAEGAGTLKGMADSLENMDF